MSKNNATNVTNKSTSDISEFDKFLVLFGIY